MVAVSFDEEGAFVEGATDGAAVVFAAEVAGYFPEYAIGGAGCAWWGWC